jgi:hypothetical protein
MAMILQDADKGVGGQAKWAARIRDRNHHRYVHETGEDAKALDLKHSERLFEMLKGKYPDVDFIFDVAKPTIHKLLLPDDTELGEFVALPLIEPSGDTSYVGHRSHILRNVPRRFQVARIFAGIGRDKKDMIRTIRSFALDEYRKLGGQS